MRGPVFSEATIFFETIAGNPMGDVPNQTIEKRYRVHRKAISLIKFILEGYDGLAVVTTRNAARGEISVFVAPGCEAQWHAIRADLSKQVFIQHVETRFS
ncbi:DUF4911 domain-containing protein [Desulfatirhabdium butyrativorans]|uniref:DUF4911 domain-containing protein n=1 Tax=Desulfatirhabdium butyrativorans TaxID=340467 RepID=UPI000413EAEE|nr:DUF4911 domain-containing protein [Desulfatirhabdium butyrativorans]